MAKFLDSVEYRGASKTGFSMRAGRGGITFEPSERRHLSPAQARNLADELRRLADFAESKGCPEQVMTE